uniref:uncharacterized protein LOC117703288 isoform X3 n=1 Tax=Arvicanthis niloticus TaxID=61156 RepID=UPI0014866B6C|nr:uncharacterized protein LOC117703288 isoform X3 [Arvicanthis niloticus]
MQSSMLVLGVIVPLDSIYDYELYFIYGLGTYLHEVHLFVITRVVSFPSHLRSSCTLKILSYNLKEHHQWWKNSDYTR